MKAKKQTFDTFDFQRGSYCITNNGILITLPCGDNFMPSFLQGNWSIKHADDETKVTVTPSIHCKKKDGKTCWHGWLRNGEFIDA